MVDVASSQALQSALAGSDGTVTGLLERLVGEPIDADAEGHRTVEAARGNHLHVPMGSPLVCRAARLVGRRSGQAYVFAVSVLVPGRLPVGFRSRLESGHEPLGRLLEARGIRMSREPMTGPEPAAVPMWASAVPPVDEVVLARTYRARAGGPPVMVISEWFLTSLVPFLPPG